MCFLELPDLMLYLIAAVALMMLLLRRLRRFLLACPGVLIAGDFWVVATLSGQLCCIKYIKPEALPLSCLFFFHTSIRMAGAVASSAPLPQHSPPPSGLCQLASRPALLTAVLRHRYCAQYAKFFGSKHFLVCAVRPGNRKCTHCQELGSKCLCVSVLVDS